MLARTGRCAPQPEVAIKGIIQKAKGRPHHIQPVSPYSCLYTQLRRQPSVRPQQVHDCCYHR